MIGQARRYLLASLLCVGLFAVVTTGGAAAASPSNYCETVDETTSVIVGGVGDAASAENVMLHPRSTLTVGYCSNGEPADNWLADGEGFNTEPGPDGHAYNVTITGETDTIDFGDHLTEGDRSSLDDRLVVTVAGGGNDLTDGDAAGEAYQEYRTAVSETKNRTAELNETTSGLKAGEVDLADDDDRADANETIYSLQEDYETMMDTQAALLDRLRSAGENGTATGTVAAAAAVDDEYQRTGENVTGAASAYADAVGDGPRSTVLLSVFGSLGTGVALGLVAGAAIPLVAARRVKEKMKLSRDVSYDRKTALIPILLGLIAAVAGVVILAEIIGFDPLLRVIA